MNNTPHTMKLNEWSFENVQREAKTIEIRLNDEKRQQLQVGDEIVFSSLTDSDKKVTTKILELQTFPTFKELFEAFPPELYGSKSSDEWELMYDIYSKENEQKYGALAIRVEVIK